MTPEITGTLDDMEPALRALGYTAIQMMAGPVDLAIADPYGMRRLGSVNIQSERWAHHIWRGRLIVVNGTPYLTDAKSAEPPFLNGLFPLLPCEAQPFGSTQRTGTRTGTCTGV